ncbi:MAG: DUF134 domain-containing protein [Candidatus Thorarchaeota archaeon]
MPRKKRRRTVTKEPPVSVYKPAGIPAKDLEEILVSIDEFEAIKLADFEGLSQRDASAVMGVSQPTFNRILSAGRSKVAEGLVQGCVLRIEGGRYMLADGTGQLECMDCGSPVDMSSNNRSTCKNCGSTRLRWLRWSTDKREGDK